MNKIINQEQVKKENFIYNQCLIYALVIGALSIPFLPIKSSSSKKHSVHAAVMMPRSSPSLVLPETIEEAEIQASLQAPPPSILDITEQPQIVKHKVASPKMVTPIAIIAAAPKPQTVVTLAQAPTLVKKQPVTVVQKIVQPKQVLLAPVEPKVRVPVVTSHHRYAKLPTGARQKTKPISIQYTKVDLKFIAKMEGTVLRGYVPLPKTTNSGVTIGSGLDLGQLTVSEFNKLPMDEALQAKLRPYVGLKKYNAVAYLRAHPLKITSKELIQVNQAAANMILAPLQKSYDQVSKVKFVDLPAAAQTALFSFAYQYGSGFKYKSATHQLWNYYVKQDWNNVNRTLRAFHSYGPRRRQEAQLISRLI
ncbi:MAG: hypothetical protein JSR33_06100 [Proteobacteria bacterium]|nr:hypothetical protein [Pseudomonadota bacterium]